MANGYGKVDAAAAYATDDDAYDLPLAVRLIMVQNQRFGATIGRSGSWGMSARRLAVRVARDVGIEAEIQPHRPPGPDPSST